MKKLSIILLAFGLARIIHKFSRIFQSIVSKGKIIGIGFVNYYGASILPIFSNTKRIISALM